MRRGINPNKVGPVMAHIHILGVGNVGSFVAHALRSLRPPSPPVTLLLRRDAQAAYRTKGYKIVVHDAQSGLDHQQNAFRVTEPGDPNTPSPINNLIVATKSYQTRAALEPIMHRLSPKSHVLLLQNGVPEFQKLFPVEATRPRLLAGVVTHGIYSTDKFRVTLAGRGEVAFGAIDTIDIHSDSEMQKEFLLKESWLARTLQRAGGIALSPKELLVAQIRKLAVNAAINPLSAIYKVRNGVLFETPEAVDLMKGVVDEVAQVARKMGLDGDFTEAALWEHVNEVGEKVKLNYSSMYQDMEAKKRTEVDEINGWVVEKGRELGVDCGLNRQLAERVRALEGRS
jgi:2-dehydropantoate 2-reductase